MPQADDKPNCLFYVEPLIELAMPKMREWWIYFSVNFMGTLEPDQTKWASRFRLITNQYLAKTATKSMTVPSGYLQGQTLKLDKEIVCPVDRRDFRNIFGMDACQSSINWYEGHYGDEELARMKNVLLDAIGDFEPDVIFTFTNAPFLRAMFPNALMLNHESSMFSYAPYPRSRYLDPSGVFTHSYIANNVETVYREGAEYGNRHLLEQLRHTYLDQILRPRDPFQAEMAEVKKKYKSVWLWASQRHGHYGWDSKLPFQHFFDFFDHLLDTAGDENGIIFSEHPFLAMLLTNEMIDYFKDQYPNFIYLEDAWKVSCASHFLLGQVDGVICMASTLGFQALLWQKKLVVLGRSQLSPFADAQNVDNLATIAKQPYDDRQDDFLMWLIGKYFVPEHYLDSPAWMQTFIHKSLQRHRQGQTGPGFFDPVDTPETIFGDLIKMADPNVPQSRAENLRNLGLDKLLELLDK